MFLFLTSTIVLIFGLIYSHLWPGYLLLFIGVAGLIHAFAGQIHDPPEANMNQWLLALVVGLAGILFSFWYPGIWIWATLPVSLILVASFFGLAWAIIVRIY